MTTDRRPVQRPVSESGLQSLVPIETLDDRPQGTIVVRNVTQGPWHEDEELMAQRVQWANRATFTVLDCAVPPSFAPYNAVIRISEAGTEDRQRDYLAVLVR
jgi:hypothetical protein